MRPVSVSEAGSLSDFLLADLVQVLDTAEDQNLSHGCPAVEVEVRVRIEYSFMCTKHILM